MDLDKNPAKIRKMFDEISLNYDFLNNIISFFTHIYIKKLALQKLNFTDDHKIIDLCCGSGDISKIIKKINPKTKVIGIDFSSKMLEIAKNKVPDVEFIEADILNLPFKDCEFDIAIISFGLRNVENIDLALNEIYRILKFKGIFLNLDFIKGAKIFNLYKIIALFLTKISAKNSAPYKYLINSIEKYYTLDELIKKIQNHNFKLLKKKKMCLGCISYQIMIKN